MSEEEDYLINGTISLKNLFHENNKIVLSYICRDKMSDRHFVMTKIEWNKCKDENLHKELLQDQLIS